MARGLPRESLVLDPGLGFAKNARHSLELCARLGELCATGFPVLVGPSRKSFVAREGAAGGALPPPEARLGGTIAATLLCAERGAAVARVHDVAEVRQALAVAAAIRGAAPRLASSPGSSAPRPRERVGHA
jgi:dihydropteroate synthase